MSSVQPRKQRKALHNAPLHRRGKHMHAHLSEELLVKYGKRSFPVRENDTVRIVRGTAKGTSGKVVGIDRSDYTITVEGVTVTKSDGKEKPKPIDPSTVIITKLDLTDRLRRQALGATEADVEPEEKPKKAKPKAAEPKGEEPVQPESDPRARAAAKAKAKAGAEKPAAAEEPEEAAEEDLDVDEEESR